MSVIKHLRGLPKPALIALIDDLYGRYGDIDEIIEDHLEQQSEEHESESESLPNLLPYLQRQVSQLVTSQAYIDYRSAQGFSERLEQLLVDICDLAEAGR